MNTFETITEYEILKLARQSLEQRWDRITDRNDEYIRKGCICPHDIAQADKLEAQIEELTQRMTELQEA